MINVSLKSNTVRKNVLVDSSSTPREVLSANGIPTNGILNLNGTNIVGADLDDTFEELGVADESDAMLISVIKADSAR